MSRFIKIGAAGEQLAQDAAEWVAVLDTKQGLTFTVAETREMTHAKAVTHVAALDTAGFKDWRLPTVEELFLLADRSRNSPAIDIAFFPNCKSDWYWTGTLYAPSPGGYAWFVYFSYGVALCLSQDGGGFVRACRAGQ
jgi:hypothetical protein